MSDQHRKNVEGEFIEIGSGIKAELKGQPVGGQKPSVARVVHYQSYGTPGGEFKSEPRAAIITAVEDEEQEIVSLCVLNPTGMFFNQHVTRGDEGGQWNWPPRV